MIRPLFAVVGLWLGALIGTLHARWRFSCRKIGHVWERCQIDGAHCRDPASLSLRMCKRCGHTELAESERVLAVADVVAHVMANDRNKPRPTPLPSDGENCNR